MKKTLRLLLFEDCNRSCEGCCNKQWDLSKLPVVKDFTPYDEIILTGGEPMLHPEIVDTVSSFIRLINPTAKIILYTAMTTTFSTLIHTLKKIDGLTVTLHDQQDVIPFLLFDDLIDDDLRYSKSLRLNIFSGVHVMILPDMWKEKENIEWLENCPLPDNEVFMRL